jgi:phosphatidylserine decarboxylase
MVSTAWSYSGFLLGAGLVAFWLSGSWWALLPFAILILFVLNFFRDPDRTAPAEPGIAVSPADGKVVLIRREDDGRTRLAIFLNVFDVHVNRTPVAGVVEAVRYQEGKFLVASKPEASTQNEMNTLVVRQPDGNRVEFSQIAGLIARRILCWKKPGDTVNIGERIGLIKFGSRLDILFDDAWGLSVKIGDRVSAGESVIARRKSSGKEG